MGRRLGTRLLLATVFVLLVLRYAGGVEWGARAAVAVLLATLVMRIGIASVAPLQVRERRGPPRDAVSDEGLPVYFCAGCGTQLLLLRVGNDRPPRHCGEPMGFELVRESGDEQPPAYDDGVLTPRISPPPSAGGS